MSVYFAQASGYVKIGYSANPLHRIDTVTTNGTRPDDLPRGAEAELIGWIPGNRHRETELHRHFAASRVEGEWFVLDADEARDLVWADPRGVDVQQMSAMAVFVMLRYPDLTRADLTATGVRIECASVQEVFGPGGSFMRRPTSTLGGAA